MRFFTNSSEAKRYVQSRPYFHPLAIARAKAVTGLDRSVPIALDIACGTGQSATALLSIAEKVIGFDISWNMLANAARNEAVRYVQARAESIPIQSSSAQVMSTALALHWFERDQFLREAWRVLTADGLLLIYNNGFTGNMRENPTFQNWSQVAYLERFPIPPRNWNPPTPEEAAGSGFAFIAEESYENEVVFTPEELVDYLTTQTNVAAAIDQGQESLKSAKQWLLDQVRQFFVNVNATFVFRTRAWYLRKEADGL